MVVARPFHSRDTGTLLSRLPNFTGDMKKIIERGCIIRDQLDLTDV